MIHRRFVTKEVESVYSDYSGELLTNYISIEQESLGGITRHFQGASEAIAFALTRSDQREDIKELLWSKYGIRCCCVR